MILQTKVNQCLLDLIWNSFITSCGSLPTQTWGCAVHRGLPAAGVRSHSNPPNFYFSSQQQILSETCRHLEKQRGKIKVKVNYREGAQGKEAQLICLGWTITLILSRGSFSICLSIDERSATLFVQSWHLVPKGLEQASALMNLLSPVIPSCEMYGRWLTPALTLHPNEVKPALNCSCDTNKWRQRSLWFLSPF